MTASDSRKVQKIVIEVDPNPVPRDYKFDMELSRDVLRKMFAERFTYSDLTQHDIEALEGFIGIESAFLFCDGSYFTGREAISFNSDGFIGFCGWADDKNSMPFLVAFYRWVNDWLDNSFGGHYREIAEVNGDD